MVGGINMGGQMSVYRHSILDWLCFYESRRSNEVTLRISRVGGRDWTNLERAVLLRVWRYRLVIAPRNEFKKSALGNWPLWEHC